MIRDRLKVALKDLIEQAGEPGALKVIRESLREGALSPEDFSLREIWEATERDKFGNVKDISEAVSSDMFPKITGELINAKVIDAYQAQPTIGDQITTTVPSKLKTETVAGFDAVETPEEVQEGRDYNDSDMGEKYVTITNKKYGRILSITEEMIYFDQTGQVLDRARRIGEKAALYKEKLIVEKVIDKDGDALALSGTAGAEYASGYGNLSTSSPFGESGLDAVHKLMANMTDENGDPVLINPNNLVLLYPADLRTAVLQMAKSAKVPEGTENAVNIYAGTFKPLTSYYITAQSSTTWFLGDFKSDFWWLEVWPLQVFTAKPGNEREFRADIKSMHKIRFFGACGAVDYRHSFKATA